MKSSRLQYKYRSNASKLHKEIGEVLRGSPLFNGYLIYQEYPVYKLNPNYKNKAHKFDWVILDLHLVIEAHGKQHYEEVQFGKGLDTEAQLISQKHRDLCKMSAAEEAGFAYVAIPYTLSGQITEVLVWDMYLVRQIIGPIKKELASIKTDLKDQEKKLKAKAYRHQQYLKQKEWKNKIKEQNAKD